MNFRFTFLAVLFNLGHTNDFLMFSMTRIAHTRSFNPLLRINFTYPFTKLAQEEREAHEVADRYCKKVIILSF